MDSLTQRKHRRILEAIKSRGGFNPDAYDNICNFISPRIPARYIRGSLDFDVEQIRRVLSEVAQSHPGWRAERSISVEKNGDMKSTFSAGQLARLSPAEKISLSNRGTLHLQEDGLYMLQLNKTHRDWNGG